MARRDRDPRPPVEILGAPPAADSVEQVAIGGGRRWWPYVAAALVLLVGVVALAGGGGGDGTASSTTSTVGRSTSTSASTTTTLAPLGPILPVQTGASLLLVSQGRDTWRLVDLDTGTVRDLPGVSADVFGGLVAVRGGVVVADGENALYRPILSGHPDVVLGPAFGILSSGHDDSIWLIEADDQGLPTGARLVDLAGHTKARRTMPNPNGYMSEATIEGPVVGEGGRAFLLTGGAYRPLGVGNPVASRGDGVVLDACSDAGRCGPIVVDTRTGARREVSGLQAGVGRPDATAYVLFDDGQLVEVKYPQADGKDFHLRWADVNGRLVADGDVIGHDTVGGSYNGPPEVLPAGQGLVWGSMDGTAIRIRPNDRGGLLIESIPGPPAGQVDRVLVIKP